MAKSKSETNKIISKDADNSAPQQKVGRPKSAESEKMRIARGECVRTAVVLPKEIKRCLDIDLAIQRIDDPSATISSIITPLLEEYYRNKNFNFSIEEGEGDG